MKLLSIALLTVSLTVSGKDGSSCVDPALVRVFNAINNLRKEGSKSKWAIDYTNLLTESTGEMEGKWAMRQNNASPKAVFKTLVVSGRQRIEQSNKLIQSLN